MISERSKGFLWFDGVVNWWKTDKQIKNWMNGVYCGIFCIILGCDNRFDSACNFRIKETVGFDPIYVILFH